MGDTPKVFVTSILNDIRRKFDSSGFEGGAITSILGNTYVYPAENWDVQLEIVEIAGRCKDRRKEKSPKKASKHTLRITGVTILGDVYIR